MHMDFDAFVRDIEENRWRVHGATVRRHGQLLHTWGDTDGLHPVYSAAKSVTAMAAGIAMGEGRLSPDTPVLSVLPKAHVSRMSPLQKECFAPLTLHRLMSMSVGGFPFRPQGDSWLDASLACPLEDSGTPVFCYSNICAYLTGVAVTEAMGQDAGQLIAERIFAPLGIEKYRLGRCPEGYFYGASAMELSVESLSRLGQLMLDGGVYRGRRILPEAFVKAAASVQQMNREGGYGYFFWKYRDGFRISGKWNQKSYILPRDGLVITYLSDIRDDSNALKKSMEKHLLGLG